MNLLNILLAFGGEGGGGMEQIALIALIFVVFYFFFIRPQTKKNKDQKKFREALKKGDKVVTIGGIHGKVLEVKDKTVIVETEDQSKLKMEKSAIAIDNTNTGQEIEKIK